MKTNEKGIIEENKEFIKKALHALAINRVILIKVYKQPEKEMNEFITNTFKEEMDEVDKMSLKEILIDLLSSMIELER